MKIDQLHNAATTARTQAGGQSNKTGAAASRGTETTQTVSHLHQHSLRVGQDVDHARIGEIRQAIREGKLEVDTQRIADRLIDNLGEWMGGK